FVKGRLNGKMITLVSIYAPNTGQKAFFEKTVRKLNEFMDGEAYIGSDLSNELEKDKRRKTEGKINIDYWNLVDIKDKVRTANQKYIHY
uniref:Uncharacterized protein n=1 Tax=Salvator merianae TaxID=96440 RepID=A0A8D0B117_SALMN